MAAKSFTGGAALEKKLAEIAKRVAGPSRTLRVGFLEGGRYPDEHGQTSDVTAAQTAFWLNYGHGKQPARPFFTDLISEKSDSWGDALGRILVANDWDVDKSLNQLGEGIEDQIRDAIFNLDSPALSPVTLMLRKMLIDKPGLEISGKTVGEAARRVADGQSSAGASTKIGVVSGHMSNSVGHEVTE